MHDEGMTDKLYAVELEVHEEGEETAAVARLRVSDDSLSGWGRARRNPTDPDHPKWGDELAIARALSDLAHKTLDLVAARIEAAEGAEPELHL